MTAPGREDTELIVRLLSSTGIVAVQGLLMTVERKLVSLNFASWNQLENWLRRLEHLRKVA